MTHSNSSILIELPVEWMTSAIPSEATLSTRCYTALVTEADRLGLVVETTPAVMYSDAAPRRARPGQPCISYHSFGDEDGVWRVKEGYLPGYFTFDRLGYSGFSELARHPERFTQEIEDFDLVRARSVVEDCRTRFLDSNLSKYAQPEQVAGDLPRDYVFFPLQTVHDAVQQFARIRQEEAIVALAAASERLSRPLVIKRHPYCQDAEVTKVLDMVTRQFPLTTVVEGPVRDLIAGARSVVGANSGVLFEALLAQKPVHSFADSDFALATQQLAGAGDLEAVFADGPPMDDAKLRFLGWYLASYCFTLDDPASIGGKLLMVTEAAGIAPDETALARLEAKLKTSAEERQRRDRVIQGDGPVPVPDAPREGQAVVQDEGDASCDSQDAARDELLVLNLVRDAYNLVAECRADLWEPRQPPAFSLGRALGWARSEAAGAPALPQNKRETRDQAYYSRLHENEEGYRQNNWLVLHLPMIARQPAGSVLEVGCGNGAFLRQAAAVFETVIGADWVQTETLPLELENVSFQKTDLTADALPKADLVCSADVLEHIPVEKIDQVLASLVAAGGKQFHVIACYDDGHSHLSVFDPGTWLALFRRHLPDAWLFDITPRFRDSTRLVCVITNIGHDLLNRELPEQEAEQARQESGAG